MTALTPYRRRTIPRNRPPRPCLLEPLEDRKLLSPILLYPEVNANVVAGPDGNMWFLEPRDNQVGRITPSGQVTEWDVPLSAEGQKRWITGELASADGSLFLTVRSDTASAYQILRLSTDGQFFDATAMRPDYVQSLISGPDNHLWFLNGQADLGQIGSDGQLKVFDIKGMQTLSSLATGADGNLWFVGSGTGSEDGPILSGPYQGLAGRMSLNGQVTYIPLPEEFQNTVINDLTPGPGSDLYFTTYNSIGRIALDGSVTLVAPNQSNVADLTAGPDGNMWFIDGTAVLNPLRRMDAQGQITPIAITSLEANVNSLATDSNGNIWYTDANSEQISAFRTDGLLGESKRLNVEHQQEFTTTIASFTDRPDGGPYEAIIDFGDGVISAGSIVPNAQGGFDVVGSATYAMGWHNITVTVTSADGRSIVIPSIAYSIPPSMAGKGTVITPSAGSVFRGTVATFVGLDASMLQRYSASVDWGDGRYTAAQLTPGANGTVEVVGTHVYVKPGQYDVVVYIYEDLGQRPGIDPLPILEGGPVNTGFGIPFSTFNDARTRCIVGNGILDGDIASFAATDGIPYDGPIARFTGNTSAEDLAHYSAIIEWENSNLDTVPDGTQTTIGIIKPDGTGGFTVSASHLFLDAGYRYITVRIYDDRISTDGPLGQQARLVGIATGNTQVRSHLSVTANPITATGGVEFTGKVGHITSIGSGSLWSSTFKATVYWGDGTSSEAQVSATGNGGYDIIGTHTYEFTGFLRFLDISVYVTETRTPIDPAWPVPNHDYSASASTYYNACTVLPGTIVGFAVQSFTGKQIAVNESRTMDIAVIALPESDPSLDGFTASLLWDDGATSPVTFGAVSGNQSTLYTTLSFATTGYHKAVLTVTGNGATRSVDFQIWVYQPTPPPPPPIGSIWGSSISGFKGVPWSGEVGQFRPTDSAADISEFTATIYWADGSSSDGTLTRGSDGSFHILGSHTFLSVITDGWGSISLKRGDRTASNSFRVNIKLDPTRLNADGRSLHFRQREAFTSKVATFTSPDKSATPADFTATIDWGNGQITQGVITAGYNGTFEVAGTMTYETAGSFTILVTVTGPGGTDVARSTIYLDRDPVVVTPAPPRVDGLKITGLLATFIDEDGKTTDPDSYRVYHRGLVDWGDGSITFAIITENPDGTFNVVGSHVYDKPGDYTVRLVVRRNTRILPKLYRWDWRKATDGAPNGMGESDGEKFEYGKVLFTLRVTDPGVIQPRQHRAPAPPLPPIEYQPPAPIRAPESTIIYGPLSVTAAARQQPLKNHFAIRRIKHMKHEVTKARSATRLSRALHESAFLRIRS